MATLRICSIPDCGKPVKARGWCQAHWTRWSRNGDPLGGRVPNGEAPRYFREVVLAYEGDECLEWPYARDVAGYGFLWDGDQMRSVSRLVCEERHGPPPFPKAEAAHSCGKGHLACCTKRHLTWKTHAGNMADKLTHGTTSRGEHRWNAKLTEADIHLIRALKGTMPQREIAEQFGISSVNVSLIHRREAWAWLE